MDLKYEEWSYLYPPRPEQKVSTGAIFSYEKLGWFGQAKLNGTCNVFGISPDRKSMRAMTRHNEDHKAWAPSAHTLAPFKNLPGDGWYVFVSELLHSKGNFKDINYVHTILVADGVFLFGKDWEEQQAILHGLFPNTTDTGILSHTVIDDHTWLAKNHPPKELRNLFAGLVEPYYEGIVMKNPKAKLGLCSRESSNSSSQVKSRKPAPSYTF